MNRALRDRIKVCLLGSGQLSSDAIAERPEVQPATRQDVRVELDGMAGEELVVSRRGDQLFYALPGTGGTAVSAQVRGQVQRMVQSQPHITPKQVSEQLSISRGLANQTMKLSAAESPPAKAPEAASMRVSAEQPGPYWPGPRQGLGVTRQRCRELIEKNPTIGCKEAAALLGIGTSSASFHLGKLRRERGAAVEPQGEPPAEPQSFGALDIDAVHAATETPPALPSTSTSFALWSDGRFVIERKGNAPVVLQAEETRALLRYLDNVIAIPEEIAA